MLTPDLISVILPVYNSKKYVNEAIDSILAQTYVNFELIIIDDGSTDGVYPELQKLTDHRVKLVQNEKNEGLIYSLNKGIKLAQGNFIARMDADDISLPQRLEVQKEYLIKNPDIAFCGTNVQIMGTNKFFTFPEKHEDIVEMLTYKSAFAHPTIMFNTDKIGEIINYDENFTHAEDYELWTRLIKTKKAANIQEALVIYRVHNNQVSSKFEKTQQSNSHVIKWDFIAFLATSTVQRDLALLINKPIQFQQKYQLIDFLFSTMQSNKFWSKLAQREFRNLQFEYFEHTSKPNLQSFLILVKKYPKLIFYNKFRYTIGYFLRCLGVLRK